MWIQDSLIQRVLDSAQVDFGGVYEKDGWGYFYAVYRIDHHKVTFKVPSKNPRESTLKKYLFKEFSKRIREIDLCIDVSWSNYCQVTRKDPWSLYPLIKKYIDKQYKDFPFKAS